MSEKEREYQEAQQQLEQWFLGKTSKRYESGNSGPGTISSGRGDHGGVSYGTYQLATNTGTLQEYLRYSNNYNHAFDGLVPKTAAFNQRWKDLANNDTGFHNSQHNFIAASHYEPQLTALERAGYNFSERGKAIQDMVWSNAVQYRNNTVRNIQRAERESGLDFNNATDAEIIIAVQDSKLRHYKQDFRSSSPAVQAGVRNRIIAEKESLLQLDKFEKLIEDRQKNEDKNLNNEIENKSLSKYEETRSILKSLLNDKDGSYAKQLLVERADEVSRFEAKIQERLEREKQQEIAGNVENNREQEELHRGLSRYV